MFISLIMVVDRKVSTFLCIVCIFLLIRTTLEQTVRVRLQSRNERVALIQLRSSLGLRSREWPIKGDPCLNWAGVVCKNGRVVEINISGFKRTRKGSQNPRFAVDALANLTLLESFNASNFLLPGSIPDWFGQRVSSLKVLDLRSSSVIDSIPSSIGNLINLTALYLSHNSLTGIIPFSIGQLSSLSVLDLSQNSLTGSIPLSFSSLGNLTSLNLASNFLSGSIPSAIAAISKLESLNLSNNSLSSSLPAQMGDLLRLVHLDLSFNSLSGSLPEGFRTLTSLRRLEVKNNSFSGSLQPDIFFALRNLQFIVLCHNRFAGNLPDSLWTLPGLIFLDVSENNFTGLLPNNVTSNANGSGSTVLNISSNQFYGVLTSSLSRFSSIDLAANYFQGRVPGYLTQNASFSSNCLTNVSDQRSQTDCAAFYTDKGLTFDNFGPSPPSSQKKKKINRRWIILAGVLGGLVFIVLLIVIILLLFLCTRRRASTSPRGGGDIEPVTASGGPAESPNGLIGEAFSYQQILQATDNFNDVNLIKHGHSGDLFKGMMEGGIPIVIKRIDLNNTVKKEAYISELDLFTKISHTRLVPFIGHCLEIEDNDNLKLLVYKFMPNSDLSSTLYRKKTNYDDDGLQSLDWITRLKIAIGAAEGLSYLHHECSPPRVHRDVQASSILLDDKFEVRLGSLSDVSLQESEAPQSRITRFLRLPSSSEQGTSSGSSSTSTCAYDVYCFGKVLLELVTGKLGMSALSESETKEWMETTLRYISIYDKELITNIVDPSLIVDEDLQEEVWAMAVVARSCLNPKPSKRPLMRYILKALENPLKVVREENMNSARLRRTTTSSRGSWNAALFGSWRHSTSDVAASSHPPPGQGGKAEVVEAVGSRSFKKSGPSAAASHGSGGADIFPELSEMEDVEGRRVEESSR
ncbi:probable LRR receptor-like serine/threonine-protein kinase At2g16250 isoform X2 [Impatiens glandulifera]|uniref:probable LRR receptor-like serine/threonine-protein kinase At2g16250 isoform X2 n=1 Tax=Impatiens glandulifera TaxID=253017 RepID=UPI001FB0F1E7|nr:probable LRR receptor-like serine/threonine-protein kinase At2g16250 isoform X2 [Impatiens glandulifera]